ncbi:MAG: tRNA lysidine(34) synthetase TilS [Microbacteriaceae bacterium]|nr:tRNA lysidine(34) synthetase TilS [Microbacteriaceae bacterium]
MTDTKGERRGKLSPAVAEVRSALAQFLDRHPIEIGGLVLVAVSGGADSLALAAATRFMAAQRGFRVGSIVVDHGVQSGSADIAERVAASLRALGLDPVEVVPVVVGTVGGPEAAARDARYAALRAAAKRLGADLVLTGHTRNDQAETVLLGLARGSGPGSIRGMSEFEDGIGRPLLDVTRGTTRAATIAEGLDPWDDPHNTDERFTRVRVRHSVLPVLESELGPGIVDALARTASLVRDDDDALDLLAAGMAHQVLGDNPVSFAAADVASRPRALRTRIIRIAAKRAFGTTLTRVQTHAIDALLVDWHGQGALDVTGGSVVRHDGRVVFTPASED